MTYSPFSWRIKTRTTLGNWTSFPTYQTIAYQTTGISVSGIHFELHILQLEIGMQLHWSCSLEDGVNHSVFCWQNFLPIQIMTTPTSQGVLPTTVSVILPCWKTEETTKLPLALYTAFPRGLRYHLLGSPSVVPEGNWTLHFAMKDTSALKSWWVWRPRNIQKDPTNIYAAQEQKYLPSQQGLQGTVHLTPYPCSTVRGKTRISKNPPIFLSVLLKQSG